MRIHGTPDDRVCPPQASFATLSTLCHFERSNASPLRAEARTPGGAPGGCCRCDLGYLLVDAPILPLLLLRSFIGGQPARRDSLVDALVFGILERRRNVARVLSVRLRDLRQRLS
jgi:hypothetical protein